jgi:uncharacterized protein YecE (DUF72 family)
VRVFCGTSGYAFAEWRGTFYPEGLSTSDMLRYYASQLPSVEINNTFYRLPSRNVLQGWALQVPEGFVFSIKASQRISHHARLKGEARAPLEFLLASTAELGPKLGPILFQLPPNLRCDVSRLRDFLALLPPGRRFVFEFRHASWFAEPAFAALEEAGAALGAIQQEDFEAPLVPTARWGYLRLHRREYNRPALLDWARRLAEQPWDEAYVYFKHDGGRGSGPTAAREFLSALA